MADDHSVYPCPYCERQSLRQRGYILRCDRCGWDSHTYCDFEEFVAKEPYYECSPATADVPD